jgi:hypothetical protein
MSMVNAKSAVNKAWSYWLLVDNGSYVATITLNMKTSQDGFNT